MSLPLTDRDTSSLPGPGSQFTRESILRDYRTAFQSRQMSLIGRREVFTGNFPASTLVQVAALAEPSVKVEIEAVAHIGAGAR